MRFMSITLIFFFTLGCACVRAGDEDGDGDGKCCPIYTLFFSLLGSCYLAKEFFFKLLTAQLINV